MSEASAPPIHRYAPGKGRPPQGGRRPRTHRQARRHDSLRWRGRPGLQPALDRRARRGAGGEGQRGSEGGFQEASPPREGAWPGGERAQPLGRAPRHIAAARRGHHPSCSPRLRRQAQVRRAGGEGGIFFLRSSDRLPLPGLPESCEGVTVGVARAGDRLARVGPGKGRRERSAESLHFERLDREPEGGPRGCRRRDYHGQRSPFVSSRVRPIAWTRHADATRVARSHCIYIHSRCPRERAIETGPHLGTACFAGVRSYFVHGVPPRLLRYLV